jgi:hypothetical protein
MTIAKFLISEFVGEEDEVDNTLSTGNRSLSTMCRAAWSSGHINTGKDQRKIRSIID